MAEIIRNRKISPSSRLATSKNYKIDTKQVTKHDTLVVNIDHESKPFRKTFKFRGKDIVKCKSIAQFKLPVFTGIGNRRISCFFDCEAIFRIFL